jgi:hypothetical protein
VKAFDLRLGQGLFGLAQLREVLGTHVRGEQADDRHHHQQFKQGETSCSRARGCATVAGITTQHENPLKLRCYKWLSVFAAPVEVRVYSRRNCG